MSDENAFIEAIGGSIDAIGDAALPATGGAALWFLFGPSIVEVGKAFGDFTSYRLRNLLGIGEKVRARIGDSPPDDGEKVHPRVAKALIEEGSWIDDDVAQEYFAGMMLSARSSSGKEADDAYYARLTASLGPDHLRLHHIAYSSLVGLGETHDLATSKGASTLGVYIPFDDIRPHVESRRWSTAANILSREELIGEYAVDPFGDLIKTLIPWAPDKGFAFKPTTVGAQLFLRAYGIDRPSSNELLTRTSMPPTKTSMPVAPNARYAPGIAKPTI